MKLDKSIILWITLHYISKLSPSSFLKLLEHFKFPENVFKAKKNELLNIDGVKEEVAETILDNKSKPDIIKIIDWIETNNIKVLRIIDKEYPVNLKSIFCPPPLIYIKGELLEVDQIAVAIVGSRTASVYGKTVTQNITKELILSGITIISGMARGIDSAAHETALSAGGRTIAVLGCGIDVIYPPENRNLYKTISEHGAVISEFPIGTRPEKFNFPRRNRIISGLSLGTLVIEAGEKSGSLITANYALEEGREVFAIPGCITSKQSDGTNRLIKRGEAKLIQNGGDIIEELTPIVSSIGKELQKKNVKNKEMVQLSEEEHKLLSFLNNIDTIHIDQLLANAAKNNLPNIFSILLSLELKGMIKQLPGKNFIKV
ncbi:DNA-protecting protein DprA [Candidatus Poribacteria bacterium]|nr:DNA-protecting protein DprA [Candidatus Poribacteria bacterium]